MRKFAITFHPEALFRRTSAANANHSRVAYRRALERRDDCQAVVLDLRTAGSSSRDAQPFVVQRIGNTPVRAIDHQDAAGNITGVLGTYTQKLKEPKSQPLA
jgi:hypothetical protein